MASAREVTALAPLVGVQGFVVQGVHHRPGDIGVTGGLGPGGAESDLAAVGSAALDGQEGLRDIGPASVPLDPAGADHVLGLEHQGRFRLQAVVDPLRTRIEVADGSAGGATTTQVASSRVRLGS
ncbi:hypothetical protein D3C76_805760 [compost metagenome]